MHLQPPLVSCFLVVDANNAFVLVKKYLLSGRFVQNGANIAQFEYLDSLLVKNAYTYQNQSLLRQKVKVNPADVRVCRKHGHLALASILLGPKLFTVSICLVSPNGLQAKLAVPSIFGLVEVKAHEVIFIAHFLLLGVVIAKFGLTVTLRRHPQHLKPSLVMIRACQTKRLLRMLRRVELLASAIEVVEWVLVDA